jgi:hypothetical protein
MRKKIFFCILKVIDERSWIRIRGTDSGIQIRSRIRIKMSRIPLVTNKRHFLLFVLILITFMWIRVLFFF